MAFWQGLAKLRLHTEAAVGLLDDTTTVLGTYLRLFEIVVCPKYATKETQHAAHIRTQLRKDLATSRVDSGRRSKPFHLRLIKLHFLGYYPEYIRMFGTTDHWSTKVVSGI